MTLSWMIFLFLMWPILFCWTPIDAFPFFRWNHRKSSFDIEHVLSEWIPRSFPDSYMNECSTSLKANCNYCFIGRTEAFDFGEDTTQVCIWYQAKYITFLYVSFLHLISDHLFIIFWFHFVSLSLFSASLGLELNIIWTYLTCIKLN